MRVGSRLPCPGSPGRWTARAGAGCSRVLLGPAHGWGDPVGRRAPGPGPRPAERVRAAAGSLVGPGDVGYPAPSLRTRSAYVAACGRRPRPRAVSCRGGASGPGARRRRCRRWPRRPPRRRRRRPCARPGGRRGRAGRAPPRAGRRGRSRCRTGRSSPRPAAAADPTTHGWTTYARSSAGIGSTPTRCSRSAVAKASAAGQLDPAHAAELLDGAGVHRPRRPDGERAREPLAQDGDGRRTRGPRRGRTARPSGRRAAPAAAAPRSAG